MYSQFNSNHRTGCQGTQSEDLLENLTAQYAFYEDLLAGVSMEMEGKR